MKDGTVGIVIEVFDSSKHKKEKGVNKNVVATTSHGEHKHDLLNKKYLRHSMNRIQIAAPYLELGFFFNTSSG